MKITNKEGLLWLILGIIYPRILTCATTLFSTIYMPAKYFDGTMRDVHKQGLLLHESKHVMQWETDGWSYIFGYIVSSDSRKKYELQAYKIQIQYLLAQGEYIDVDSWASMINTLYGPFTFISVEEAKKEIVKEKIEKEFIDEKKKTAESKGFLKRVFRRKSM